MSDTHSNTDRPTCRQWTSDELALMRRLAPGRPTKAELIAAFPGRTYGAIRFHLYLARRALGEPLRTTAPEFAQQQDMHTTMLDPDDPGVPDTWQRRWSKSAAASNGQFLAALQRLAA